MLLTVLVGNPAYAMDLHVAPARPPAVAVRRASVPTCLDNEEVLSKLSAVPVFGVANAAGQLMSTADAESSTPVITFYLDVAEAQASLAVAAAVDPSADLKLKIVPLGTVFAQLERGLRLQPSQAEYNGIRHGLGFDVADASSTQLVPLYYSDELNIEGAGGEQRPFFFTADEFRAAWATSGQIDTLPALQLIDLRSLASKMRHDTDFQSAVLIPSEAAVAYASGE